MADSNPLTITKLRPTTVASLVGQIDMSGPGGCWIWRGFTDNNGYGRVSIAAVSDAPILTHRLMYAWLVADLPAGSVLDHFVCDNPPCCNPDHLRLVSQTANLIRGKWGDNSRKTHCLRGHALPAPDKNGLRRCGTCIKLTRAARQFAVETGARRVRYARKS